MGVVLLWLFFGLIAAIIGARKGEGGSAFVLGILLGPFGILFALMSKGNRRPCEFCKELIHKEALKCKHCGASLRPEKAAPAVGLNAVKMTAAALAIFALFVCYKIFG